MLNLLKLLRSLPPQSSSINPAIRLFCRCAETAASVYRSTAEILCTKQQVSCIFMSCIFVSCYFMSGNFSPAISYPTISCLSFSALPLHAIGCVRLTRRQDAPTVQQITGTSSNWSIDFIFLIFPLFSVSENVTLVCPPLTFARVECKAIFWNTCT